MLGKWEERGKKALRRRKGRASYSKLFGERSQLRKQFDLLAMITSEVQDLNEVFPLANFACSSCKFCNRSNKMISLKQEAVEKSLSSISRTIRHPETASWDTLRRHRLKLADSPLQSLHEQLCLVNIVLAHFFTAYCLAVWRSSDHWLLGTLESNDRICYWTSLFTRCILE